MTYGDNSDTLAAAIVPILGREVEKPVLDCDGEVLSRGHFLERVRDRASQLRGAEFGREARIIVVSGRGSAFWIDMVAVWMIGGVAIPCDPRAPFRWSRALVDKARPQAVLGGEKARENVFDGLRAINAPPPRGDGGPTGITEVPSDATAALLFTSGSTGEPKGVVLSHRSLFGNCRAILAELPFVPEDRLLVAVPFHFTSAICHFLAAVLTGACLVTSERNLLPGDLKKVIQETGATCFGGSPLQLRWIGELAAQEAIPLRWVMSSGDHLQKRDIEALRQHVPDAGIFTVYGLTEVGARFCVLPASLVDQFTGSVGRPISGMSVSVLDDSGLPAAIGEIGHVFASGDYLFDCYFGEEEATAKVLGPKGFATGDMGYLSSDGLLYLAGRSDEVFKVAGVKCSTLEVSDALAQLGLFDDIIVLPVDDPFVDQVPKAYYVLKKGKIFNKGEVLRHLRTVLANSKIPREFQAVPSIPRTGSGKVNRKEFKAMVASL
jgi:long-chain acyl-CoA synthetase